MSARISKATAAIATGIVRVQIVAAFGADRKSPKDIANEIDQPLGTVAYHVRELQRFGVLRRAGRQQVRGATQHFYVLTAAGARGIGDLLDQVAAAVAATADVETDPNAPQARAAAGLAPIRPARRRATA